MPASRINLLSLVVVFIALLLAMQNAHELFADVAGLGLLICLFAYDERGVRNEFQSAAFALVCGLALLPLLSHLLAGTLAPMLPAALAKEVQTLLWLLATAIFFFVDRMRVGSRQSLSLRSTAAAPQIRRSAPVPITLHTPAAPPAPPQQYYEEEEAPAGPVPVPSPLAAPAPTPQGKKATIYVNMLDAGMTVLRPVQAEHLGKDFYIIVEEMPADENWEYTQGQVVRCKKKNLSSGKALVAYEEAPRAQ